MMERENKYLVLKNADLENFLDDQEKEALSAICNKVMLERIRSGKEPQDYVVVAKDWPMYESVWEMIEAFADGKPDEITKLRTELAAEKVIGDKLCHQLLAAQADNARLREQLLSARYNLEQSGFHVNKLDEALATNPPDDALKEYGAKLVKEFVYKFKRHVGGDGEFWLHELEDFTDKIRKGEF